MKIYNILYLTFCNEYRKQSSESAIENYFKLPSRMTDDFYADGHIHIRNGQGARFYLNPANRLKKIQ
ncbi:MAG: hypothetical protein WA121_03745 [Syntrophales bacterium]